MLETIRDWVVIVAGLISALWTLVLAAIFAGLWYISRKGFKLADKATKEKVRPALTRVHATLAAVRDRTARLPGNTPLPEGAARPAVAGKPLRLPFGRKKRKLPLPFMH